MRSTAVIALILVIVCSAGAETNIEKRSVFEGARLFHQIGSGRAGNCTIVQYDVCGGWIWSWEGFSAGDEIGVVFDLPGDCSKEVGGDCTNNGIWWYWRNTIPGRGFTIRYELWALDGSGCKTGSSLGSYTHDPTEGWNQVGGIGSTSADDVAVIAVFNGAFPYASSDNNVRNANEAVPCGVGSANSFQFASAGSPTCLPAQFDDVLGPVDLMAYASFTCDPASDSDEESWGAIKSLFR